MIMELLTASVRRERISQDRQLELLPLPYCFSQLHMLLLLENDGRIYKAEN